MVQLGVTVIPLRSELLIDHAIKADAGSRASYFTEICGVGLPCLSLAIFHCEFSGWIAKFDEVRGNVAQV